MTDRVETHSAEETLHAGARVAGRLAGGDVVLISGPLGAGKSVFARGIARKFGATSWRGSPTYNLIHEYGTAPPLYHADLYRLGPESVEDLGLEEYARRDSVLMVEWAERAPELLAELAYRQVVRVCIEPVGESDRVIDVETWDASS